MLEITIIAVVSIIIYLGLVNWVYHLIYRKRKSVSTKFTKSLIQVTGLVIIVYMYLQQFDVFKDASKVILQSGSLIIALATFSCQKVLGDIVSGIMISSTKPFDIGNKITLMSGSSPVVSGVVMDINTRHTMLKMTDGKCAIVTNSLVDSYVCINENTLENNGYPFVMECTYDSDVDLAIKLMEQEINANPLVIDTDLAQCTVTCSSLTANGFELKAIIFTRSISDNIQACSQLRLSIFKTWKEHGIELPYETVTVLRG